MRRRDLLTGSAAATAAWLGAGALDARTNGQAKTAGGTRPGGRAGGGAGAGPPAGGAAAGRIEPGSGPIPVAFAISPGVTVIDFTGPWEVFQDASVPERDGGAENQAPFHLYTVSETVQPLRGSAGLQLVPDHTFATAPAPRIVVVPAQRGSAALHEWLRRTSRTADVMMSVCTGAFHLAKAGLLAGGEATTHHDFTDRLAAEFPDIRVRKGVRFVEGPKISTAGGLTSGIDLALRVVDRYFGRAAAERTAGYMEYQSRGWVV